MTRPNRRIASRLTCAALSAVLVLAGTLTSEARRSERAPGNYVVAESRFGNGTVVGAVRYTSVGRQVKTPGGNWLHCERSCAETLRVNTVDFWQSSQGAGENGAIDQQDGIFGKWLQWDRSY